MKEDREYLQSVEAEVRRQGMTASAHHATGNPAQEILKIARAESCDLIAMTTHGHRFLSDLIYGTTITKVRHEAEIPIFLVKASPD